MSGTTPYHAPAFFGLNLVVLRICQNGCPSRLPTLVMLGLLTLSKSGRTTGLCQREAQSATRAEFQTFQNGTVTMRDYPIEGPTQQPCGQCAMKCLDRNQDCDRPIKSPEFD